MRQIYFKRIFHGELLKKGRRDVVLGILDLHRQIRFGGNRVGRVGEEHRIGG
jgi:hypothetical protein